MDNLNIYPLSIFQMSANRSTSDQSPIGPFMRAEIISLTGKGKLRVAYNGLVGSLFCDENNNDSFVWEFSHLGNQNISLSPVSKPAGIPQIYATVTTHNLQVKTKGDRQMEWITSVGQQETIRLQLHDLAIAQLNSVSGGFIGLDQTKRATGVYPWDFDPRNKTIGLNSWGSAFTRESQWFIGIKSFVENQMVYRSSGGKMPVINNSMAALQMQLNRNGINLEQDVLNKLSAQIATL